MIEVRQAADMLQMAPDQREQLFRVTWWTPTLMSTG